MILSLYNDWDNGIHPVSTGRAPWLPGKFGQAMAAVRGAISDENEDLRKRADAKRKAGHRG